MLFRKPVPEPEIRTDLPIAVLSFDRPHYLCHVLRGLKPQVRDGDPIILFQDGSWNPWSQERKADPNRIAQCIALFRKMFPWGEVAASEENLGVAANYERAEQEIFGSMKAPSGLFLEDDLVPGPHFLRTTRLLLDHAEHDRRIGYVSAYGNFWASRREQRAHQRELMPMHENWGFALTREAWLAERPFREQYLRLLDGCDYSQRDHNAIFEFYARAGWQTSISSQDAARWIASAELGRVRLTTFACQARYIGVTGLHSTPAMYRESGFARARIFNRPLDVLQPMSDAQYEQWIATDRRRFTVEPIDFYPGHSTRK
jgi:hypothetical protein